MAEVLISGDFAALRALGIADRHLARELGRGLAAYMKNFVEPSSAWQRQFVIGGRPGLNVRSRDLSRSFRGEDTSSGPELSGVSSRIFSLSRYARIHQKGGVIVPKRAPRLVWRNDAGRWFSAKRVVIPARLNLLESFSADAGGRTQMLAGAAARALDATLSESVKR